nr:IS1595 family transposase [Salipiger mucosus]
MECSRLPASLWMRAMWLILSSTRGISSTKLGEMLGIQQRSAWFLAHRVRAMMARVVSPPISGEIVEMDEVYAGAPPRRRQGGQPTGVASGRGPRRPLVLTAAARGGEARFRVIASHGRKDIQSAAEAMIGAAGTVMTDALPAYGYLAETRRSVTHSAKEYARTDPDGTEVHVNTAESCHADLRRMVMGVHHWISRKHLARYLADISFRRSRRETDVLSWLSSAMSARGRLRYEDLVGFVH